ncbi:MAG: phosphoadenosine phosphosulfate reductase family protein [Candidatus Methanofastidiosa archaeon]|nr:phosphoadenosine phosphosulfate reductase family protein [Candidatus Methanofastidiosa archaeon]
MDTAVLFSGGKDSSLTTILLKKIFPCNVVNYTVTFGINSNWRYAKETANALEFDFKLFEVDKELLEKAVDRIEKDGFANDGITLLHKCVIEEFLEEIKVDLIADGTRRDDRSPRLELSDMRRIEDKYSVSYLAPLMGISYRIIKPLCHSLFVIEEGPTDSIKKSDYESEIKDLMRQRGMYPYDFFPKHAQSRVLRYKDRNAF